jgi:hypothetical protein
MDNVNQVQSIVFKIESPEKIYELFLIIGRRQGAFEAVI